MKEKPSKQIYALMIVAFAIIVSAFIFRNGNPFSSEIDTNTLVNPTAETNETEEGGDTDGDGIFDWEEVLRGTDPKKIDTDSDGTSDFDEVKQNRNPLISGPDDTMSTPVDNSVLDKKESASQKTIKNTVTSELSKNLLSELIKLKQDGELTTENKNKLVNELASFTKQSFVYKKYSKDTFLILPNATTEDIRTYASNIATIQMNLITQIAQKGDAIINNIDILSALYKETGKQVSQIAVPSIFSDIHLIIANNYAIVSESLLVFKEDFDPAKKSVYIGAYQQAVTDQEQALGIIATYLRQNGISFTADQVGNYWNNF